MRGQGSSSMANPEFQYQGSSPIGALNDSQVISHSGCTSHLAQRPNKRAAAPSQSTDVDRRGPKDVDSSQTSASHPATREPPGPDVVGGHAQNDTNLINVEGLAS